MEKDMYPNLEKICRLCLKENEGIINIFDGQQSLVHRIMTCTGIEVQASDSLPNLVCFNCRVDLEKSYFFRKRSQNSNNKLKRHVRLINAGKISRVFDHEQNIENDELEFEDSIKFLDEIAEKEKLRREKEFSERLAQIKEQIKEKLIKEMQMQKQLEIKKHLEELQTKFGFETLKQKKKHEQSIENLRKDETNRILKEIQEFLNTKKNVDYVQSQGQQQECVRVYLDDDNNHSSSQWRTQHQQQQSLDKTKEQVMSLQKLPKSQQIKQRGDQQKSALTSGELVQVESKPPKKLFKICNYTDDLDDNENNDDMSEYTINDNLDIHEKSSVKLEQRTDGENIIDNDHSQSADNIEAIHAEEYDIKQDDDNCGSSIDVAGTEDNVESFDMEEVYVDELNNYGGNEKDKSDDRLYNNDNEVSDKDDKSSYDDDDDNLTLIEGENNFCDNDNDEHSADNDNHHNDDNSTSSINSEQAIESAIHTSLLNNEAIRLDDNVKFDLEKISDKITQVRVTTSDGNLILMEVQTKKSPKGKIKLMEKNSNHQQEYRNNNYNVNDDDKKHQQKKLTSSDCTTELAFPTYEDTIKIFRCNACPQAFSRKALLQRHEVVHEKDKGFSCDFCGKWFACRSSLKRHTRIHTGEKPFTCEDCGRSFIQKEILKRHILTHTGERPHKCPHCDRSFVQKPLLRQHINQKHSQNPIKELHECHLCSKVFLYASGLSRHLITHTGISFTCDECDRSFSDKSALKRHKLSVHVKGIKSIKLDSS